MYHLKLQNILKKQPIYQVIQANHHAHCHSRQSPSLTAYPQRREAEQMQSVKMATILLIAEERLCDHLAKLLRACGYSILAVTDIKAAVALQTTAQIDLIVLHCTPEMTYGGWETYTDLHKQTTMPLAVIGNITCDHFRPTTEQRSRETRRSDIKQYLSHINSLCQTVIR